MQEESREGTPKFDNPVLEASWKAEIYIQEKYGRRRTPPEARRDAMIYAAAQLSTSLIEPYLNPEAADYENLGNNNDAQRAEEAIKQARIGNWQPMKEFLQGMGHLSMSVTNTSFTLGETASHYDKDVEKSGEAFFNIANSLGI